ncbi:hypothetical protein [Carboxylicivirga sp. N1Y90]|uniref:hypothetical protein n=1 Tax=Carboxylicivirga fragile TaxID=3417571 RepID=UPI003D335330|nr:hypothetical protein [Marinilabiliaceae bacterium N1Y90]
MKKLKTVLAVGLFVMGLGFTSCSSDDNYTPVNPEQPEVPVAPGPENPVGQPPVVSPS